MDYNKSPGAQKPSGFFYLFNCGKIGTYKLVIR